MLSLEYAWLMASRHCLVTWWDFGPHDDVNGVYYRRDGVGVIGIGDHLRNPAIIKSTVAEELGHHWTAGPGNFVGPHFSFSGRTELSRVEQRALRWAANMLIDDDEFMAAGQYIAQMDMPDEEGELASIFEVTREIVRAKWQFLSAMRII